MNNIAVIENIIQILQYIKIIGPFPFTPSPPKFMKNNHIINFVTINDILYDKQFGFRKGHSTNHAIITLVDKVARSCLRYKENCGRGLLRPPKGL